LKILLGVSAMKNVPSIPKGYHTITPHLVVSDGQKAIDFYTRAFDASLLSRLDRPDGKVMHAELKIGDSIIMLADECPPHPGHEENCVSSPETLKGSTVNFFLYVENVDEFVTHAAAAGAKVTMPVTDMFWGDRYGQLKDPFGHFWGVLTHVEDVTMDEVEKRAKQFAMK
jgi:PhnB protein